MSKGEINEAKCQSLLRPQNNPFRELTRWHGDDSSLWMSTGVMKAMPKIFYCEAL